MDLVTPDFGLAVWTSIAFLILMVLMRKFAWTPILEGVQKREESIADALQSAESAREEMAKLQSDNEKILKEAREERDTMLKDAKEIREKLIGDAKGLAQVEADRIVTSARESIETEKSAAMAEIKNHVAALSIDIAEKVLKNELADASKQKQLVDGLLNDIKLN